jgi:hypothetical protein
MRKWLAAWAARGWICVRALNRGLLLALALGTAATVFGAPVEVTRGLAWLQVRVQADGSLVDQAAGGQDLARCESAATLFKLAGNSAQVVSLLAALQSPDNATETLACWQQLQQQTAQAVDGSNVGSRRVALQGYSAYAAGNESSVLDSGWALAAHLPNLAAQDKSTFLSWLQSVQRPDGSLAVAGKANILTTAIVLRALKSEASANATAASIATSAAAWLLAKRNAQGNWLGDVATTSVVFEAVQPFSGADAGIAAGVQTFLLSQQQPDGSWQGDAYVTAVALRALVLTSAPALDPTRSGVKVKFIDARIALPVPGVRLQASSPASVSTASDVTGVAQLTNVQPGAYQFSAGLDGYASVNIIATLVAGEVLDLGVIQLLPPPGSTVAVVSGTVREQGSNQPIPGATVSIDGQSRSAVTAEDGSYLISNVTAGTVTLSATRSGYLSASMKGTALAGQVLNFSPWLSADPGTLGSVDCKIVGRIVAAGTQLPLDGVTISLSGANTATVFTSDTGRYASPNLVNGLTTVRAARPGYDTVSATAQVQCSNLRATVIDFSPRLYPEGQTPPDGNTASLAGIMIDAATNSPIAGVQLVLTPSFGVAKTAQSAANGKFSFTGLNGATAQLQALAPGYQGVTLTYALPPINALDIGEIRLRAPTVQRLAPDLRVLSVKRTAVATDPQTLAASGALDVQVGNVGTQVSSAGIAVLAFSDLDGSKTYNQGIDTVLGQGKIASALVPGQTTSFQITVAGVLPFRDAPISVVADPLNQVAELSETNNAVSTAEQAIVIPSRLPFVPKLKYKHTASVMMSPVVGRIRDTNGDGKINEGDTPQIVFSAYAGNYQTGSWLKSMDGATGALVLNIPPSLFGGVHSQTGLSLADLDGDAVPEIVATKFSGGPVVLSPSGLVKWQGKGGTPMAVGVADIDGDGQPEVLHGNIVYTGTGAVKSTLPGCSIHSSSYAVRVKPGTTQQIVCGGSLYDTDGTLMWRFMDTTFSMVGANLDGGTHPQFVVTDYASGRMWLLNHLGEVKWGPVGLGSSSGGPVLLADFDSDGSPEIGIANKTSYRVYRGDGSLLWSVPTSDPSAATGAVAFDFDGDGLPEIVYRDSGTLRVFDGRTGQVLFSTPSSSLTGGEFPVVADVDGDGHADIVVPGDMGNQAGIFVYSDASNAWVATRPVWNQSDYSNSNINDDLSVPRNPLPSWQSHNTFRLNKLDGDPRGVPDLTAGYVRVSDVGPAGTSSATFRVGNAGAAAAPAATSVAVYGRTQSGSSALVATTSLGSKFLPGQYVDLTIPIASLGGYVTLTVVVDDDGTGKTSTVDFDRSNNSVSGSLPAIAANLTVSAATDMPAYTETDQAVFTATFRNIGSFAHDAFVLFTVLDAAGQVVDVLPVGATTSVPAEGTASVAGLWPVAGILSGAYQLRADLYSPAGLLYSSATIGFTVTASQAQAASARISADRMTYTAAQTVQVFSRVANMTTNAPQDDARAVTTVRSASGHEVFNRTEAISQLGAGAQLQYIYPIAAAGLAVGTYQANLQLRNAQGAVLAQSNMSFSVQGTDQSGVGLTGQLHAAPNPAFIGTPVAVSLTATNNGSGALADVPVTLRVLEPESGIVLGSVTQVIGAWPQALAQTLGWTWSAQGLDGQTVLAIASASVGGRDIALGQATVRLVGIPRLQAEPLQLTFTPIYVGENAGKTVTVSSIGTVAAGSLTFSLAGQDASKFAIPQGGCTQSPSLPIGAQCTLTISWRPQAAGSQAAEVQISYDRGEPLRVSVAGQAKPVVFIGTVATDAPEVEVGRTVGLSYTVSNPATVTSQMAGSLSVRGTSGQTLSSWPLQLDVGGSATYAGGQPYTTSAEAQSLTVALSQTVGTSTLVLATTTFTVVDRSVPLGVGTDIKSQARILVLVSCPPGLGTAEDAACVAQRGQAITNYLSALGYTAKVVATREAFVSEMRCGTYNTYWISGGAIKLDELTVGELREAVYRGEALWMDGVHDSRNQLLHAAAGVKEIGKLPDANFTAALAETGVYGIQAFATRGQVTKFELTTGSAEGLFTQVPGQQAPIPAIVSNNYGRGKSLLYAFDLAAMVTADALQANAQLRGFITTSATHTASGSPTLTTGDVTQLSASINNLGARTVALRAEATLPAGLVSLATNPQAQLTANTDGSTHAVWAFTLPGGATQDLSWLVRVVQIGSYSMPLAIYSQPGAGSTPPKLRATSNFTLEARAAATLLQDALAAVNAVEPTTSSDKSNTTKAVNAVAQATALHSQGSYQRAIAQWLAAANALIGMTSVDTATARSALALAIEASADALCIQRCGTADCQ